MQYYRHLKTCRNCNSDSGCDLGHLLVKKVQTIWVLFSVRWGAFPSCNFNILYKQLCLTVTVTVTGNLLNTKALTLVSRLLSQPVQSPNDMPISNYTSDSGCDLGHLLVMHNHNDNYICIYVYTYIHTHTHTHTYIYIGICNILILCIHTHVSDLGHVEGACSRCDNISLFMNICVCIYIYI